MKKKIAKAPTSVWLHCVVRAPRPPVAALRSATGLPGGSRPRLLEAGSSLWLVVSDVPRADWEGPVIERRLSDLDWLAAVALAHESVVERFVAAPALLPAKLFTLFHDDARALAHLGSERARIARLLERVAARTEFGVRIALDEAKALRNAERDARRLARGSSGAGFLLRKKRVAEVARAGGEEARALAATLHRTLADAAVDAVRKEIAPGADGGGSRLLLDAAYLVERKRARAFRGTARALAKDAARAGLTLALTGPWPAYHFTAENGR